MVSNMENEKRAEAVIRRYGFDFDKISKEEIRNLIENEIVDYQPGSSEYMRVLCGYLYCIGDETDVALLKHAKYDINMDVGCMIDGEWIDSLKNGGIKDGYVRSRKEIIESFIDYYEDYINDEEEKIMILFVGIQASGKTTFFEKNFKGYYEHINLDTLNTRNKEWLAIKQCIEQGRKFVVDNTNPTKADREKYIAVAKEHGYQVIGYYFKSCIRECIERNEQRTGKEKVPRCAIAGTSNKLELPDFREGFDELYYVYIENMKSIVEEWRFDDEI